MSDTKEHIFGEIPLDWERLFDALDALDEFKNADPACEVRLHFERLLSPEDFAAEFLRVASNFDKIAEIGDALGTLKDHQEENAAKQAWEYFNDTGFDFLVKVFKEYLYIIIHVVSAYETFEILMPEKTTKEVNDIAFAYALARREKSGILYAAFSEASTQVFSDILLHDDPHLEEFEKFESELRIAKTQSLSVLEWDEIKKEWISKLKTTLGFFGSYIHDERFWEIGHEKAMIQAARVIRSSDLQSSDSIRKAVVAAKSLFKHRVSVLMDNFNEFGKYSKSISESLEVSNYQDLDVTIGRIQKYGCGAFGTVLQLYLSKTGSIYGDGPNAV